MRPFAMFGILDQPGSFQRTEMEGYLGLHNIHSGNNLANAEFSIFEEFQYPESGLIRQ
jgi:hypothetical protein